MLKRCFDLSLSLIGLFCLLPVLLILSLAIIFDMGRPVFFKQSRPGLKGKPFLMWKFRSMNNAIDELGTLLPDEQRITKLGQFLRMSSLDELPGLWCVVNGSMSLVGPRPLLNSYLKRYTSEQAKRHDVKPGITGWAQINGRNAISWEEKFKLDVWYVENQGFLIDLKILLLTFKKVFVREGINNQGHATMPEFMGSSLDSEQEASENIQK